MSTILVVEDNEFSSDLLVQLLGDEHDVITATDGERGIDLARIAAPDLILMDLSLPGVDGWEATRRLKADHALGSIPVVAVTAHAMAGDREKAQEAGCDGYLTKPVDEVTLYAEVARWLNKTT